MIEGMSKALALVATLALAACTSSAQQSRDGSTVVAQVGDRAITLDEIEARWRESNPTEHAEALQKVYDGRRSAIDAIVADMLFAEAARGKGLSPEAYEEAEVSRRAQRISDADVESFYRANINEMQGRPLEAVAPLIQRFLDDQARTTARQALIAELRKTSPPVRVTLEAPRYPVVVADADPARGRASAPVTIIEFSDFECPYCQRVSPTLKQITEKYGDKVRVVWKDFPLTQIHPQAFKAAEAAHCAGDQGRFWEYHDRLFADQRAMQAADLKRHAADLKLDAATFAACLDSSKHAERVRDGMAAGNRLGVSSTPTMYINGRMLAGAYPYEAIAAIIDEELERAR
jgi:protein-disulfide isomerase